MTDFPETDDQEFIHCVNTGLHLAAGDEESFDPFAILFSEESGRKKLIFSGGNIQQAMFAATNALSGKWDEAHQYGLVWDGYVTINGTRSDCLFIEYGSATKNLTANVYVQRYKKNAKGEVQKSGDILHYENCDNRFFLMPLTRPALPPEWSACVRSPFVILSLLDGKVGAVDKAAFEKYAAYLTQGHDFESQGLKMAIDQAVNSASEQVAFLNAPFDPIAELTKAHDCISQNAQDGGVAFCAGLFSLGEKFSRSAARENKKVNKKALAEVAKALALK